MNEIKNCCNLCPRECNADRSKNKGFCGVSDKIRISRVGLHMWEEPCLSYGKGSGTVFFAGCNLKCVFCQNYEISKKFAGKDVDTKTLENEILKLQNSGAEIINLVTPTHYADKIAYTLENIKEELYIPVVYNCGGYEKSETVEMLAPYIDIFLPDIKYFSPEYSDKYSHAKNYFEKASEALDTMINLKGYAKLDENGHMRRGVLVRHLVLPGLYKDSIKIFEYLAKKYEPSKLAVSIMSQYFPTAECEKYPEINRHLTSLEYEKVVSAARELGFVNGYIQERTSAKKEYVPSFDYK